MTASKPAKTKPHDAPIPLGTIAKLDQRTAAAKLLRQRFDSYCADLGGREGLTNVHLALVDRLVFVEAVLQTLEAEVWRKGIGGDILAKWTAATNSYNGIAKTLGLPKRSDDADVFAVLYGKPAALPAPSPNGEAADEPA